MKIKYLLSKPNSDAKSNNDSHSSKELLASLLFFLFHLQIRLHPQ